MASQGEAARCNWQKPTRSTLIMKEKLSENERKITHGISMSPNEASFLMYRTEKKSLNRSMFSILIMLGYDPDINYTELSRMDDQERKLSEEAYLIKKEERETFYGEEVAKEMDRLDYLDKRERALLKCKEIIANCVIEVIEDMMCDEIDRPHYHKWASIQVKNFYKELGLNFKE